MSGVSGRRPVRIAIASGKGGTGKTLVATNLAAVMGDVTLVDLDVEEPNCHLFQKADGEAPVKVYRPVPEVDEAKCTLCGRCGEVCQFHAIVTLPKEVMVFSELCHGCGACSMFCPENAISERGHHVGDAISASGADFELLFGRLRVSEAMPTFLIRHVRDMIPKEVDAVLDCPPGTACASVESIRGADLCILVTEPTPFGFHDLKLALGVTKKLGVRSAVFINKDGLPGPDIEGFCREHEIPIIGRLRLDRDIAERYSRGELLMSHAGHRAVFETLRDRALEAAAR
jgi:MinD superfamily P-loop ATPase